ncbi:MAG TPA: hypothetical protein VEG64_10545 [Candidatus Sulfotelmatobacter sp.]|nr:hypothetical protein [Candidatus Sulfotelmatobacter sp.]
MTAPKRAQSGEAAAQAARTAKAPEFDVDTLLARDRLGLIREALDSFEAEDLRSAAEIIWPELAVKPSRPAESFASEELRKFLLQSADQLDLPALVRVAERLGHVGYSRLGEIAS